LMWQLDTRSVSHTILVSFTQPSGRRFAFIVNSGTHFLFYISYLFYFCHPLLHFFFDRRKRYFRGGILSKLQSLEIGSLVIPVLNHAAVALMLNKFARENRAAKSRVWCLGILGSCYTLGFSFRKLLIDADEVSRIHSFICFQTLIDQGGNFGVRRTRPHPVKCY